MCAIRRVLHLLQQSNSQRGRFRIILPRPPLAARVPGSFAQRLARVLCLLKILAAFHTTQIFDQLTAVSTTHIAHITLKQPTFLSISNDGSANSADAERHLQEGWIPAKKVGNNAAS